MNKRSSIVIDNGDNIAEVTRGAFLEMCEHLDITELKKRAEKEESAPIKH